MFNLSPKAALVGAVLLALAAPGHAATFNVSGELQSTTFTTLQPATVTDIGFSFSFDGLGSGSNEFFVGETVSTFTSFTVGATTFEANDVLANVVSLGSGLLEFTVGGAINGARLTQSGEDDFQIRFLLQGKTLADALLGPLNIPILSVTISNANAASNEARFASQNQVSGSAVIQSVAPVPLPPAVALMGAGLFGLCGTRRLSRVRRG